jgi:hypothetical protein
VERLTISNCSGIKIEPQGEHTVPQKIVTGSTDPHDWKPYPNGTGVFVEVNTSSARFTTTPLYFSVYLRWAEGDPLTPADAAGHGWYINWMAIENT